MKKIKSFFSRFKDEKGFGILGLITVVGLISVAVGLHSVGEYSIGQTEKVQKSFTDMQNLPDTADTTDADESYYQAKKSTVDAFKKLGEESISLGIDDTAGLGLIKETGVFDIPKNEKDEQENSNSSGDDPIFIQGLSGAIKDPAGDTDVFSIEEKLNENNLPTDAITQDITKIVINVANQLGSSDSELADIIDTSIDVVKDLKNKDKDEDIDNDSSETLEIVKEKLSEINKLEDEEIINKRKEHNLSVLEKKQLEKEIEIYKYYKDTDNVIISDEVYIKIQQRLDYLNDKIDALENELQEDKKSEEDNESQNIEDVLTDEEITEEVIEEIITLSGTMGDEVSTFTMSMTIDLNTGAVSGIVYFRINLVDLDYKFETDVPISGSMNLETREINAQAGELKLTGRLSTGANSANGTASSEEGSVVWSVSR